ncbi:MAG: glycosyltransferase [Anaerolineae bacterium]|nr:glycosyltransferase [Anaerolineae bacterium]
MTENAKKHVLMLVNTHVYDDPRVINEAISLVEAGYLVSIIGAARSTKAGFEIRSYFKGIEIILTPVVNEKNLSSLWRELRRWWRSDLGNLTEAGTFRRSNLISLIFFNLWCWQSGRSISADVIHCHDFSPLPVAWLLARFHRAKFIYDSHESAPDFYGGFRGKLIGWIERIIIRKTDYVITVGERLVHALKERGAPKVALIGNWKRLDDFSVDPVQVETERERLELKTAKLVIVYLGTLDDSRELRPLVIAVSDTPDVILLIGGAGTEQQIVEQAAQKSSNIRWLGWVESNRIPLYTALADVVYYCLKLNPDAQNTSTERNNYYSTPNKLFEAFAAGKALIARRGVGEIGEILEQIPASILLDDVTPETLKTAFQELQNPERLKALQAASLAARDQYNWAMAEERLRQIYVDLTS